MTKMKITYYPMTPMPRKNPTTVWRFFDGDKVPEMYQPGEGWVENGDLYLALATGETDIISESEALVIVKELIR
jgi:hypothetical protein